MYQAIYEMDQAGRSSINRLCYAAGIPRSAYYKWLRRVPPEDENINAVIIEMIQDIHEESPDKGYRRIKDDLLRDYGIYVNDKNIYIKFKVLFNFGSSLNSPVYLIKIFSSTKNIDPIS